MAFTPVFLKMTYVEWSNDPFMRVGKKPPLRGTVVMLSARNYLIYTLGYIPYFRDYPGMANPAPAGGPGTSWYFPGSGCLS
jgi:hypothetical protein